MTAAVLTRPDGGSRIRSISEAPSSAASLNKSQRRGTGMDRSFQDFFQDRWIAFLKESFHSPEQIGVCFGVTAVTAQNWLNGTTCPRGPFVAWALMLFPREAGGLIEQDTECAASKRGRSGEPSSRSSGSAPEQNGSRGKQRAA